MARRKWNYESIQKALDGENVSIQSGYTKKYKHRKVGETWTDAKGTWKKTGPNSISKVNTQMDSIRELIRPRCSVCNMDINLFGDKADKKIHSKTGKCFACLEIEEQTLKLNGKFENYETEKLLKNKLAAVIEFKKNVLESIKFLENDDAKVELVCANGEIVTWHGGRNNEILKMAKEDLIKANNEIKDLEHAVSMLK